MKRVRYIFPTSHHYRLPFHERLRALLAKEGVDYRVVYSAPGDENRLKQDTVEIAWGVKVACTHLLRRLSWQHALGEALRSDLAIVQQENSLVLNYVLNLLSRLGLSKLAYFGHGRNFQSRKPGGLAEKWKRFWATKCDWWFGYTDETRRHVESLGFPPERITVFNNAVDTTALRDAVGELTENDVAGAAVRLGLKGRNVAIFVGGLYPDKRLEFLALAADRVRERIPDFELVFIGGGVELGRLQELAASRPWMFVAGPRFGNEKAALMRGAKLFLMPGLVGLAILDAAALSLPTITTAYPWHSPEIAYLKDGENGVIVQDWEDTQAYADAVADLLLDDARRGELARAAHETAQEYTIEAMASNFAKGVLEALGQGRRS